MELTNIRCGVGATLLDKVEVVGKGEMMSTRLSAKAH